MFKTLTNSDSLSSWINTHAPLNSSIAKNSNMARTINVLTEAERIGISFPYFYSSSTLARLVEDETRPDGPLAVVLISSADFRNGELREVGVIPYFSLNGPVSDLQGEGYRVTIREINSACGLPHALDDVSQRGPISLLLIVGHGSSERLEFDSDNDETCTKEAVRQMKSIESWKNFAPDSQVILISCSTGKGRATTENVANMLRSALPRALVTNILAPTDVLHPPTHLHFDRHHHVDRMIGTDMPILYKT
jgi:hypothetical protein